VKKILLLLSLGLALFSAEQIQTGSLLSDVKSYKFETPTGKSIEIPDNLKLIIIAFEKDTGALVNDFLNTKIPHYLVEKNAIYIADIHSIPTIFTNMFALPKLKKFKHPIYLHYDDEFQKMVPNEEEKVTLLYVKDRKIINISFITTEQELKEAIEGK